MTRPAHVAYRAGCLLRRVVSGAAWRPRLGWRGLEPLEPRLLLSADLSWNSLSVTPVTIAIPGNLITLTRNYQVSSQAVTSDFSVSYHLSTDTTWGNADDLVLAPETVTAAGDKSVGGHSQTLRLSAIGPLGAVGTTYRVLATVDAGGTVAESNESNNLSWSAAAITVGTTHDWLAGFWSTPIDMSAGRNAEYVSLINASAGNPQYLNLNVTLLETSTDASTWLPRDQISKMARLAFLYATPGNVYYQDSTTFSLLRRALLAVAAHVQSNNEIYWTGETGSYLEQHEQGWRLEDGLSALVWVGNSLSSADRTSIETALRRTGQYLVSNPLTQHNNRGLVWSAVTTMAGLYWNQPSWIPATTTVDPILTDVIQPNGETGERLASTQDGPCENYSYTSISYAFEYRMLAGRTDLDPLFLNAAKWFAQWHAPSSLALVPGAAARKGYTNWWLTQDVLPVWEYYSSSEPYLAQLVENYLAEKSDKGPAFNVDGVGMHSIHPMFWSMLLPGVATPAPGTAMPDWLVNNTQTYSLPYIQYGLVNRQQYSTGVTFRGQTEAAYDDFYLRGMQTFAVGSEYPILMAVNTLGDSNSIGSQAYDDIAGNVNTRSVDVSKSSVDQSWEVLQGAGAYDSAYRCNLATFTDRRSTMVELYAYTPVSTVVIYSSTVSTISTKWVFNRGYVSQPTLSTANKKVTFAGRQGALYYLNGTGSMHAGNFTDTDPDYLLVPAGSTMNAFGFSDGSFQSLAYNSSTQVLSFRDASGSYTLSLANLLTGSNLNRSAAFRLTNLSPTVTINQATTQADPTGSSPINFSVLFSQAMSGFATGDVTLAGTAGATTALVTGSGTTYNVAVSGMTGNGTVIASIAAGKAVNGSSIGNLASTSSDNTVTFVATPPVITLQPQSQSVPAGGSAVFSTAATGTVLSYQWQRNGANLSNGGHIDGATSAVLNVGPVDAADVGAYRCVVTNPAGSATSSSANLVLDLAPTVTLNRATGQADPGSTSPINFTVLFSEPVNDFATGDVSLSGTAGPTMAIVTQIGPMDGTTYNVAVTGMIQPGTVIASLLAGVAHDGVGNASLASSGANNVVTFAPVAGDADGDGDVDGADLTIWFLHVGVGAAGATWPSGNFDGDTDVDGADLTLWFTHVGASSMSAATQQESGVGALGVQESGVGGQESAVGTPAVQGSGAGAGGVQESAGRADRPDGARVMTSTARLTARRVIGRAAVLGLGPVVGWEDLVGREAGMAGRAGKQTWKPLWQTWLDAGKVEWTLDLDLRPVARLNVAAVERCGGGED